MFDCYEDPISVENLMEALNIGHSKVYEFIRNGQIESLNMKAYRMPKATVKEYVLSKARINIENYM